jgi:hypothetical protein
MLLEAGRAKYGVLALHVRATTGKGSLLLRVTTSTLDQPVLCTTSNVDRRRLAFPPGSTARHGAAHLHVG